MYNCNNTGKQKTAQLALRWYKRDKNCPGGNIDGRMNVRQLQNLRENDCPQPQRTAHMSYP